MNPKPVLNLLGDRLHALPLLVVYLTDGCNSKCVTCDIWREPRRNMSLRLAEQLAGEFRTLGVREVLLSGGEPLQHPRWPAIAQTFRQAGARLLLVTNGLLLKTQADDIAVHIDEVTVSLDAATPALYEAIRGVDGFELVLDGVRAVRARGVPVTTRTTVQRANYHQMPDIVRLGRTLDVTRVSFLPVDTSNVHAFGPRADLVAVGGPASPEGHGPPAYALAAEDLPQLDEILDAMEADFTSEFAAGFIAESPAGLRQMRDVLAPTVHGELPARPRCNAPHVSTVVEVDGRVRPCFFLPLTGQLREGESLHETLNQDSGIAMRRAYRTGQRDECAGCVCPLYRGPSSLLKTEVATNGHR